MGVAARPARNRNSIHVLSRNINVWKLCLVYSPVIGNSTNTVVPSSDALDKWIRPPLIWA